MRLALSGFLLEDDNGSVCSFDQFVSTARSLGYDAVELRPTQVNPDTPAATLERYRSVLRDNGLVVSCLTTGNAMKDESTRQRRLESYLLLAEKLSCRMLKVSGEPGWLHQAADLAARGGVTLAINNHLEAPTESVAGTLEFLRRVNHPNFALLYDCMHLAVAGEAYVQALRAFLPHMRNVLIQCLRPAGAGEKVVLQRHGICYAKTCIDEAPLQDWPAVISELKRLRYDDWFTVIENNWPAADRRDIARRTAQWVKHAYDGTEEINASPDRNHRSGSDPDDAPERDPMQSGLSVDRHL